MGRIPGISHIRAVRLTIARANPINAHTMAGIVKDAGLTSKAFADLL